MNRADPSDPTVLRDYAFLADGERGVAISPRGDMQWMCFPSWDSPSLFSSMLRAPGSFTIQPRDRFVSGGHYEEGTLIWRSHWAADGGVAECREALAYPGNPDRAILLRQMLGRESDTEMRLTLHPCGDYSHEGVRDWKKDRDGVWTGTTAGVFLRFSGAGDAKVHKDETGDFLELDLVLSPGDVRETMLEFSTKAFTDAPPRTDETWLATEARWQETVPSLEGLPAQRDARHAYAILAGLTSSSGGMVAAGTMALPESMQRGGSYDYRYAWIRDQAISGQALSTIGADPLMDRQTRFVIERVLEHGAKLKPAYTVKGGRIPTERHIDVPGYPGGSDVVGNKVGSHFQLDMSGDILLLLAAAARHEMLEVEGWRAVQIIIDAISERHNEADNGIWELEKRQWTHSRLMCAAGLRAIAAIPQASGEAAQWLSLADQLVAEVGRTSVHHTGRWQRAADDERLDASLLVPALRGATAFEDPRNAATIEAVAKELTEDGYVYRYSHSDRRLGQDEGAFLLCGFWLALAKHRQGDHGAAAQLFERNRAACGPSAVLAEEFDITERQLRGNLPQAFVHALLLETTVTGARDAGTWKV